MPAASASSSIPSIAESVESTSNTTVAYGGGESCSRTTAAPRLEPHELDRLHRRQRGDLRDDRGSGHLVESQEAPRRPAASVPALRRGPELDAPDVDLLLPEDRPEHPDDAGQVGVQ